MSAVAALPTDSESASKSEAVSEQRTSPVSSSEVSPLLSETVTSIMTKTTDISTSSSVRLSDVKSSPAVDGSWGAPHNIEIQRKDGENLGINIIGMFSLGCHLFVLEILKSGITYTHFVDAHDSSESRAIASNNRQFVFSHCVVGIIISCYLSDMILADMISIYFSLLYICLGQLLVD